MVFLINGVEIRSRLYIKGETNNVRNYQIIIVNSLVKKLFRCIMEAKLITWVENITKKAIDKLIHWKCSEELKIPSGYMLVNSCIYKKVICHVCAKYKISSFFNNTIGFK